MDRKTAIILILGVLVLILIGIIVSSEINKEIKNSFADGYLNGTRACATDVINNLYYSKINCEPFAITLGNSTSKFWEESCLR